MTTQGGTVRLFGDTVRYTPAAGFTGTDTFEYTITDLSGQPIRATVSVLIAERPALSIVYNRSANTVTISWPFPSTGFELEATPSLTTPDWQPVAEGASSNGDRLEVTLPVNQPQRYFRLHKPPGV